MASQNGPTGLYTVKSYHNSQPITHIPDCMYKLKSVHGDDIGVSGSADLQMLESRQDAILATLRSMKDDLDRLVQKSPSPRNSPGMQAGSVASRPKRELPQEMLSGALKDLVIHANPANPPLSLLVLQSLLSEQYSILTACHAHSTANGGVSDKLRKLFGGSSIDRDRKNYQLAVTLVWKDVKNGPLLMVNPVVQSAICGEGNIARYLARILNPAYDSGDIIQATEIDTMVDLAMQLIVGNNKEKASVLRTINAKLGKCSWLVGTEMSLADIVMWSAIKQANQESSVPSNVKKWLSGCLQVPAFQRADAVSA